MNTSPTFERSALVTNDPILAARISALHQQPSQYFTLLSGPRMSRPDVELEIERCYYALGLCNAHHVMLGGMSQEATSAISFGGACTVSDDYEVLTRTIPCIKRPIHSLLWGISNLGIGVYRARIEKKELVIDSNISPTLNIVKRENTDLLVMCESGNNLAEVMASNLAFSCNASFAVFPELQESLATQWMDEMYEMGEKDELPSLFKELATKAREHLGEIDFSPYQTVLFVTSIFPWGIAVPEVATTHMYRQPDFGRALVEGMWACHGTDRSSRTALLIDPETVDESEIPLIKTALAKNGTFTRVVTDIAASVLNVQLLLDFVPQDIIVLASHAGDAPGKRCTYAFEDEDGRSRQLVVDEIEATSAPLGGKISITNYQRFHSIDGVKWNDSKGKAALPMGTSMTTWNQLTKSSEYKKCLISEEEILRVKGSMAMQLHDGVWLFSSFGFASGSAPVFINSCCWSWHEMSMRTMYAGARAYVGTLFPISDEQAKIVAAALFDEHKGKSICKGLWLAQRAHSEKFIPPYLMVGLPFVSIQQNTTNPMPFITKAYEENISYWAEKLQQAADTHEGDYAHMISTYLTADFQNLKKQFDINLT